MTREKVVHQADELDAVRHSLAHLLAAAVLDLYPGTKNTIGPAVEHGFYYDFEFASPISETDLPKIEAKMREILPSWKSFERQEVTTMEARTHFAGNPYKLELIGEFSDEGKALSLYTSGSFTDLCRGGHVTDVQIIDPAGFTLDRLAGAYWRGKETNTMLTRIYGLAFASKADLDAYLALREEAKKRDHRKFGKQLDLFTFSPLVGSGLPLFTPRGAFIRKSLNDYIEELQVKAGYEQVWTPQIVKADLFKMSGHYDKYRENLFRVHSNYSEEEFYLKPMNCPQHTQIYASQPRSYRDLPIRYTDFAMLYRDEKPGELSGLARVRSFSQDDCHVFCREDQVDAEIDRALAMTKEVMETFGLKYRYRLSTSDKANPEKYLGDPATWAKVEAWAERIMKRNGVEYFDGPGEAAFYAPKMDLIATDALGREWQLSTVQIDFFLPERFNLTYTDADGKEKRPIMIHRAIIGSSERFIMVLLEHYAGALPTWLSPVQVRVLAVGEKYATYAAEVAAKLRAAGIRTDIDDSSETLGKRIRAGELAKIPYTLVVGEKEVAGGTVNVRTRRVKETATVSLGTFITKITKEISTRQSS
ncbi:MAG: threonine--tRNA ligase [bacterium]|nr:threonine--tRNA ligase [bacterium]